MVREETPNAKFPFGDSGLGGLHGESLADAMCNYYVTFKRGQVRDMTRSIGDVSDESLCDSGRGGSR
jgi:hypothetical protein